MRKSRSEAAETRERIVSTASKKFLEHGLGAVGMREIMAAANLTQGGFYRHFESKEQLIAEANSEAFDRLFGLFERESAGKTPGAAVGRIVSLYLGQAQGTEKPYLCPLSMLGAELSHGDPRVRAVAADGYQRLVQFIADRLEGLAETKARVVASGVVSTMVGAVTLAEIAPEKELADAILAHAAISIQAQLAEAGAFAPRPKQP